MFRIKIIGVGISMKGLMSI